MNKFFIKNNDMVYFRSTKIPNGSAGYLDERAKASFGKTYKNISNNDDDISIWIDFSIDLLKKYNIPEWEFREWMANNTAAIYGNIEIPEPTDEQAHL